MRITGSADPALVGTVIAALSGRSTASTAPTVSAATVDRVRPEKAIR
ncbi:hypothetical protein [Azospirillum formosense]